MKIAPQQSVVSGTALVQERPGGRLGAIAILHARGDIRGRLSLIGRRRQQARVRAAGHVFGWAAGVAILLALVSSAAIGLR